MQGAENTEKQKLSAPLRARMWKYRMISVIVCALAVWIASKGNWNKIPLSVATVVLIIGVAIWMLGSPDDYNGSTDICSMIAMDCPRKIEEFYEAYKDVRTPLGSAYLVQFYTMKQPALMFGPDKNGDFLYFWLSKDGNIGYLGYSFMTSMIKGSGISGGRGFWGQYSRICLLSVGCASDAEATEGEPGAFCENKTGFGNSAVPPIGSLYFYGGF